MMLQAANRKRKIGICGSLLLVISMLSAPVGQAAATDAVVSHKASVQANGKSYAFDIVTIDLSDPHVRVATVEAQGGIGHVESLQSMINRTDAVAAINGTFFDAYIKDETQRFPNGLLLRDGAIVRSGENQSLLIRTNNTATIAMAKLQAEVTIRQANGKDSYTFNPWAINTYYGEGIDGQTGVFTRDYGATLSFPNATFVVVDGGVITQVTQSAVDIPPNGFVIFIEGSNKYVTPNMKVGAKAELKPIFTSEGGEYSPNDWVTAIGVGPKLVSGGEIDFDPGRDGFTDPKITANAGARSFVGVDGSGRLVFGTFPSATVKEMAVALQAYGLVEAMNMDGGASSSLFVHGTMKRPPGRELSNALIVQYMEDPQVQVAVNGQFVSEFRGYIDDETTMVPFRGIFSRIGADFTWDGGKEQITANKGGTKVLLTVGDRTAIVNGQKIVMPKAPVLRDGYTYIPLRFITEKLGAKLDWDGDLFRASIRF